MKTQPIEYRLKHNYWESFRIVLATFYERFHTDNIPSLSCNTLEEKMGMYISFDMFASTLGHRMFLPYKHIPEDWNAKKIMEIINGVIVPESELVICDTDIPSIDDINQTSNFVTGIVARAQELEIPVVHLVRMPTRVQYMPEKSERDGAVKYNNNLEAYEGVKTILKLTKR
jgi:hypothetical protein